MSAKVERLVALVVTLLEARRPLTLRELKERTGLYGHDRPESARRMFERDKDELRRLGIPVETRPVPRSQSGYGYIIDRGDYELPEVDLTRDEVAALAVAVRIGESRPGRLGLTKLATRAPDPVPGGEGSAPPAEAVADAARVAVRADPLEELAEPLLEHRAVRFGYRTGGGRSGPRTVDPYAVVARRGAWYLVGRDHDRDDLRTFRLDRMTTGIEPVGDAGAFELPADLDVQAAVSGPERETVEVTLSLDPTLWWEAERRGGRATGDRHGERPVYRFEAADPERLRPWVLSLGPRVEVLAPSGLREAVAADLRGVLQHVTGAPEDAAG